MPTREIIIREVLLTDDLTYTPATDRATKTLAFKILTDGDDRLEVSGKDRYTFSVVASTPEANMHAATWHMMIAAARCVLLTLERAGQPLTEATLRTDLVSRGFDAEWVSYAVNMLRGEKIVAWRAGGLLTDLTGSEHRRARRLSPSSLAPSGAPQTVSTATTTEPSTTAAAARHRMDDASDLTASVPDDPMAFGRRLAAQQSASFDPGDLSMAPPAKTAPVTAEPTIPDGVLTTYISLVLEMWAKHGKTTAKWRELPWSTPDIDLPEGITHDDVAHAVFDRLIDNGTIVMVGRGKEGVFTFVPARDAVDYAAQWLIQSAPTWDAAVTATIEFLAATTGVQRDTPNGWAPEVIARLALDAAVAAGALVVTDGVYRSANPKPVVAKTEPEVVETPTPSAPVAPAPAPTPSPSPSPTTTTAPSPSTTTSGTGAPASGQKKAAPTGTTPASSPTLEKKVDVIAQKLDALGAKFDTLPPPPSKTATIIDAARSADIDVVVCLEDVLVALFVHDEAPRSVIRDRLPGRVRSKTTGRVRDRRPKLGAALALGTRAGVIAIDNDGKKYRYITHADVLDKHAWKARLDRRLGTAA